MSLQSRLPWTESPLIVNAPMGGIAGPALAISVTRAGGVGLMGLVDVSSALDEWLDEVEQSFTSDPITIKQSGQTQARSSADLDYLPVGVGFLLFITKLDDVIKILRKRSEAAKRPPAIVWLFAATEPSVDLYSSWSSAIRKLYSDRGGHTPQIWIQVGGSAVAAAKLALSEARPDAIVVQGSDAGGHGMERTASLIGLLPEFKDLLTSESENNTTSDSIPHVLASGGIVDARGALAAFSIGAEGVIMGTRFLASPETLVPHPEYRKRVLAARDGAQSTIRAKIFDELRGPNMWPVAYDGRALVSNSWRDLHEKSVPIETIRDGHQEAVKEKDGGYGIDSDRAVVWCGTGVGLVNDMKGAGDVVKDVRDGVIALAEDLTSRLVKTARL